ncbi:hypothetical protein AGMMS49579_02500 [Spirochaetia bacterium]|nr:hypothetical protein AGMMS49579_02500 [Spirochaetia bacterium]
MYRILIGLVLGIILGLVFREKILWIKPFGDIFVRLLKMIMMPIILSTLIVGASSVSPASLGKVGVRVIVFYLLTSAFAVVIGLLMGTIFRPSANWEGVAEVITMVIKWIMEYAPIGVLALVSVVFADNGPKVIGSLGVVTAACFSGYAIHIVLVYFALVKFCPLAGI